MAVTDIEQSETFGMHRDDKDRVFLRVGPRMYPAYMHVYEDLAVPEDTFSIGGRIYRTRQCRLRFETGWELSVIWGTLTYSENRDRYVAPENVRFTPGSYFNEESHETFTETPRTVEVMAFPPDGYCYEVDEHGWGTWDDPFGWCTVAEVQALIDSLNTDDPQPIPREN